MIKLDYENVFAHKIDKENGLDKAEFEEALSRHKHIISELRQEKDAKKLQFAELPYDKATAKKIIGFAKENRTRYKNFVHIGIGGSSLGAVAIHTALNNPYYNLVASPKFYFLDNIDPAKVSAIQRFVHPKETLFHIVTKSGETTETVALFMVALSWLKRSVGKNYKRNLVITTDRAKGFLRKFAAREGITTFETPDGVCGRFSALSPVGLLSASFARIDIERILAGAAKISQECFSEENNIAYLSALINFLLDTQKGKHILVTMPYADALRDVADWFRQIWAESLGKKGVGQTPVTAVGAIDQHSQIQLYNEGPNDKIISFIDVENFASDVKIQRVLPDADVAFLHGRRLGEILRAEKRGTEEALTASRRPNYTLLIPKVSPETVGALLYLFEVQTVYAAKLYNVNPFDQPGVEAGKQATFRLLGKK